MVKISNKPNMVQPNKNQDNSEEMTELWVYAWNISHIQRNAPDEIILRAWKDPDYKIPEENDARDENDNETYEVERYTPDEFAELLNDEAFDDTVNYIRFIRSK